ncbi:protein TIFY 9-like [Solanum dulcamara]|uniref:protein TIFY 9-like n=1 Tax=Solanum dulcamara TaxID=45834 RepID=UPI002485EDC6|nr:protein TIFY 9-like [Solanum dulcamara]
MIFLKIIICSINLLNNQTMARSTVELDFFSMEKESSTTNSKFEYINSVISKIDSTESANAVATAKGMSLPDYPLLPIFNPTSRLCCCLENGTKIAPLTIFYDGTAAVFHVTNDEAEDILKFAERTKIMNTFSSKKQLFVETLSGDLSFARRNSLLRFLEKRKERLTMVSPYGFFQSSRNKN